VARDDDGGVMTRKGMLDWLMMIQRRRKRRRRKKKARLSGRRRPQRGWSSALESEKRRPAGIDATFETADKLQVLNTVFAICHLRRGDLVLALERDTATGTNCQSLIINPVALLFLASSRIGSIETTGIGKVNLNESHPALEAEGLLGCLSHLPCPANW
jgi:hypothetical protein